MLRTGLLNLLLVLSLGLATVGFGVARGQAPAVGTIEICSGHGVVTIAVDADGTPVRTLTLCPDAAMSLLAVVGPAPSGPVPAANALTWLNWSRAALHTPGRAGLTRGARGPPA